MAEEKWILVRLQQQTVFLPLQAKNFKELLEKAKEKLAVQDDKLQLIRVSSSEPVGITDEDGFRYLRDQDKLILLKDGEEFLAQAQPVQNLQPADQSFSMENLKKVLREVLSEKDHQSVAISKMSKTVADSLVAKFGITIVNSDIKPAKVKGFKSFRWSSDDERKVSAGLAKHLSNILESHKLIGSKKYRVLDVHEDRSFFRCQVTHGLLLKGGADAVITPYQTANESASTQLRIVVDWKQPTALGKGYQFLAELFAGFYISQHPCLLIHTDLATQAVVWWLEQNTVYKYSGTAEDAVAIAIDWLANKSSEEPSFNLEKAESDLPCMAAWKTIKGKFPDGPLVEQLQILSDVPQDERFDAYVQIYAAWQGFYS